MKHLKSTQSSHNHYFKYFEGALVASMGIALKTVPEAHSAKAQKCLSKGVRYSTQHNSLSKTAIKNSMYFKGPI